MDTVCKPACLHMCVSSFRVVMCLKLWQMDVHVSRCVSHFVQVLRRVVSLTEIYGCHFSAQQIVDSSHGQYVLVWKMHWHRCSPRHNTCILYENPNIDLNTSASSRSICSLKNVAVAINLFEYIPFHGNVLTWAAGGLKDGIALNDLGTPWGGGQDSAREWAGNLFCFITC